MVVSVDWNHRVLDVEQDKIYTKALNEFRQKRDEYNNKKKGELKSPDKPSAPEAEPVTTNGGTTDSKQAFPSSAFATDSANALPQQEQQQEQQDDSKNTNAAAAVTVGATAVVAAAAVGGLDPREVSRPQSRDGEKAATAQEVILHYHLTHVAVESCDCHTTLSLDSCGCRVM